MTIASLLDELNEHQRLAATMQKQHALILAGAGCGKTKTIIARAAFLISSGVPAHRIQILTFTRRSASEIVERVRFHLGEMAEGLKASTFHTWCMSMIRKAPIVFGCKNYSVIDRDDQLQLFKILRGKQSLSVLPTAKILCDLYSYARNTRQTLDVTLNKNSPESYCRKEEIAEIMLSYEKRKREQHYLDYDDILDVVAHRLEASQDVCDWVASQYEHLLIDEMQDTNPLQWKLIEPLKNKVTLFCVGDDAQSIYAFRGADFKNIHTFHVRVPDSIVLRLEKNYRSSQEILDVSNWLLSQSPLKYGKNLIAFRGNSKISPMLNTFLNEWEEANYIASDLILRRKNGACWKEQMILVRSSFAARVIEGALLAKEIPYRFIGGAKLLDSAHVRDVLSVLRLIGNPLDEIAWMRFLTLWRGVGEVTASKIIDGFSKDLGIDACIQLIENQAKIDKSIVSIIRIVSYFKNDVSKAVLEASKAMEKILSEKYQNQGWDKRKRDFKLVGKLAEKHTSILAFIEEYTLEPVYNTEVNRLEKDDVVTIITIHSAKGTECKVCYVVNVSCGSYPSSYAIGDIDEIEEERRVLYVALTRAKDELILTRRGALWADGTIHVTNDEENTEIYFLNNIPDDMFQENIKINNKENLNVQVSKPNIASGFDEFNFGINIG